MCVLLSGLYCGIHTINIIIEDPGLDSCLQELASDMWRSKPDTFFSCALVTLRAFENPFSLLSFLSGQSATLHYLIVSLWSPDFEKNMQHSMCVYCGTILSLGR